MFYTVLYHHCYCFWDTKHLTESPSNGSRFHHQTCTPKVCRSSRQCLSHNGVQLSFRGLFFEVRDLLAACLGRHPMVPTSRDWPQSSRADETRTTKAWGIHSFRGAATLASARLRSCVSSLFAFSWSSWCSWWQPRLKYQLTILKAAKGSLSYTSYSTSQYCQLIINDRNWENTKKYHQHYQQIINYVTLPSDINMISCHQHDLLICRRYHWP